MAAKLVISSPLSPLSTKLFSSSFQPQPSFASKTRKTQFRISAIGEGENELKKGGKKKFITKEEEPEQYWQTAGEREGENPMKTPLPYIIIFGMSTPFVILAIAFANGWVKVPVR
ncbi:uncharacterized protein LOC111370344 [Olea europaea var. sylvestris]|uniref:Uncharacterized protein LOC111370344 n=1 Tax=Olea europaea subsp. europaea TaxID=158383 RepID=A0A8S0T4U2_OLEEU|nr:uncharacterized protein LOC111370344 [Olea europaea var. sylvestris]CAA2999247.1 uncharacterized protein LOC111370344 [Olea europaea subsp. europaea]